MARGIVTDERKNRGAKHIRVYYQALRTIKLESSCCCGCADPNDLHEDGHITSCAVRIATKALEKFEHKEVPDKPTFRFVQSTQQFVAVDRNLTNAEAQG